MSSRSFAKSAFASLLGYTAMILILTAGAAQSLAGSNTVDSGDIIDGSIVTADLKANSITGSRVLDASLNTPDIKDGAINSAKLADNSVAGVDIDESSLSISGRLTRIQTVIAQGSIPAGVGQTDGEIVSCPSGTTMTGGGAFANGTWGAIELISSSQTMNFNNGWFAAYRNTTGTAQSFYAFARCATFS